MLKDFIKERISYIDTILRTFLYERKIFSNLKKKIKNVDNWEYKNFGDNTMVSNVILLKYKKGECNQIYLKVRRTKKFHMNIFDRYEVEIQQPVTIYIGKRSLAKKLYNLPSIIDKKKVKEDKQRKRQIRINYNCELANFFRKYTDDSYKFHHLTIRTTLKTPRLEIKEWLKENMSGYYYVDTFAFNSELNIDFWFSKEEDAMLFKLTWM